MPNNILITNDDGLHSNGMTYLEEELKALGEVWCVAPDRERSACSQALSIFSTMVVERKSDRHFTVSGFPADCVNVALFADGFPKFDLVVSGINHGVNLGDDVHYSGTVGAVRHAAVHKVPGIAVSCPIKEIEGDFHRPARFVRTWLEEHQSDLKGGLVYNMNYPEEQGLAKESPLPDVKYTYQGQRIYHDEYELKEEKGDVMVYRLKGTEMGHVRLASNDFGAMDDFGAMEQGFVSVTPLGLNATDLEECLLWMQRKEPKKNI